MDNLEFLMERLTDLADSIGSCEWEHPITAVGDIMQSVNEIKMFRDELAESNRRFAEMNMPTAREIELNGKLTEARELLREMSAWLDGKDMGTSIYQWNNRVVAWRERAKGVADG
jgi:hypothetical protein